MKWVTIAVFFTALVCTLAGYSSPENPPSANVTYLGDSNNAGTISTPEGFGISPEEADQIRIKQKNNSIAVHHIYADDKNYYICDGFFGSKTGKAVRTGLVIDGKTGDIVDRETEN